MTAENKMLHPLISFKKCFINFFFEQGLPKPWLAFDWSPPNISVNNFSKNVHVYILALDINEHDPPPFYISQNIKNMTAENKMLHPLI